MGPRKFGKANIQASKPDLPPFLQRMKERIVANEDQDRRERGERLRKTRKITGEDDDDPVVVKVADEDITEEDYKRMKHDLENNYKTDDVTQSSSKPIELDIDQIIQDRERGLIASSSKVKNSSSYSTKNPQQKETKTSSTKKKLSYSSDEDD